MLFALLKDGAANKDMLKMMKQIIEEWFVGMLFYY
jgi:hypothetical protein